MLESIKINGIRSCKSIHLDNIGPMLALVGRNGVGKTNILLAISAFAQCASADVPIDMAPYRDLYAFTARLRIDTHLLEYSLSLEQQDGEVIEGEQPNRFIVESLSRLDGMAVVRIFTREKGQVTLSVSKVVLHTSERAPAMTAIETFSPQDGAMRFVKPLLDFLRNVRYYEFAEVFSTENPFIRKSKYETWKANPKAKTTEARGSTSFDLSPSAAQSISMRILDMYLSKDGSFDELTRLVGPDGLGLLNGIRVDEHEFPIQGDDKSESSEKFYILLFIPIAFKKSKRAVSLSDLSFGTRRLLAMMVSLLNDRTSLFLLEQPEDGIHPGLLNKVIPTLRSYSDRGQFIFATHAAHVINRLKKSEVRLVEIVAESTEVRSLSDAELRAAESYLKEDGSLADFIDSVQES